MSSWPWFVGAAILAAPGCTDASPAPRPSLAASQSERTDCAAARRRCSYRFEYADRGEQRVELRGDFKADGWSAGIPMQRRGSTWFADADVPLGKSVQYKFVRDGSGWTRDPANPAIAPGADNSLLDPLVCDPYTCSPD